MKTYIIILFFGIIMLSGNNVFADVVEITAQSSNAYLPLESIGKVNYTTFPTYVKGLHKFAIGFVSIAALLMITIGGFSYMTAAGNQSQVSTAKKLIVDAILGLIVVFVSWLVLNTINPDLLNTTIPGLRKLQQGTANNITAIIDTDGDGVITNKDNFNYKPKKQGYSYIDEKGNVSPFNTKQECADAGYSNCKETQNSWDDNVFYGCNEDGGSCELFVLEYKCEEKFSNCRTGAQMRADKLYNSESASKITKDIKAETNEAAKISEDASDDMNEITPETKKEIIEHVNSVKKDTGQDTEIIAVISPVEIEINAMEEGKLYDTSKMSGVVLRAHNLRMEDPINETAEAVFVGSKTTYEVTDKENGVIITYTEDTSVSELEGQKTVNGTIIYRYSYSKAKYKQ